MPARTALLRFGDSETRTVPEHALIVDRDGYVWWGWWKKDDEPVPHSLLTYLVNTARSDKPLRIGLVNRKDDQCYVADCVEVRVGEQAQRIKCPEPEHAPSYYQSDLYPAWFKFTELRALNLDDYMREFGEVPPLDPTLYDVVRKGDTIEITPAPDWSMAQTEAAGNLILHLSDLHFGDLHGFPVDRATPGVGISQKPLADIITDRILSEGLEVGLVVVSGDLISKGRAEDYADANQFLTVLCERLNLKKDHVVIVPGNHDLWTIGIDHPTRDYKHEEAFKMFLRSFYMREIREIERIHRFKMPSGLDLVFVALNSARLRTDDLREYGYLGRHRYEKMIEFVLRTLEEKNDREQECIVGVLHHHLIPVDDIVTPDPERPVSVTLDAGEVLETMQRSGVRIMLHGHQHVPFIGATSRAAPVDGAWELPPAPGVYIIGGGSAGAQIFGDMPRNSYGIYEIQAGEIHVTTEEFSESKDPQVLADLVLKW